ncbi:hypothetical protein KIN20_001818 [Parelaphostrongylus tenuis]|uniref:Secreted protein n=1 Tax=Parelaphostrongylus tenuis TaxID=148309 RepID=A0AAD5MFN1_PARTN|nr:hypothetical protein KIN20_001818 [Parelaphostrongylus tenuis]
MNSRNSIFIGLFAGCLNVEAAYWAVRHEELGQHNQCPIDKTDTNVEAGCDSVRLFTCEQLSVTTKQRDVVGKPVIEFFLDKKQENSRLCRTQYVQKVLESPTLQSLRCRISNI